jgi:class 3 adenylate cyclase
LLAGGYCLSGPMATPHVPVQLLLAPGERRAIDLVLPPGRYRLRTLHPGAVADVEHDGGAFPGLRVTATGVEAMAAGAAGKISFANDADFELAALIEDRTWTRDALTATEVISLQVFRDLFAEATLRPGDDAAVGQIALLFTDLRGSTALYERVGDAAAFNIVREHFAFLGSIVRDHDGAVVKTIGDAVMASFGDPADAVRAALDMQARIAGFNSANTADRALAIKLGVHVGSSVMVSLNDRLDYFGSTVNMAARLQGQSTGGDIVLSRAVADDPAVRPLLAAVPTRDESVSLKGFDHPVGFVRVLPSLS